MNARVSSRNRYQRLVPRWWQSRGHASRVLVHPGLGGWAVGRLHSGSAPSPAIVVRLSVAESWIVEDREKDKTALYGMDNPLGTWAGSFKVNNDDIWNNYVKTGKVKGFSIEGYFADKAEKPKEIIEEDLSIELDAAKKLLKVKKLIIENAKR